MDDHGDESGLPYSQHTFPCIGYERSSCPERPRISTWRRSLWRNGDFCYDEVTTYFDVCLVNLNETKVEIGNHFSIYRDQHLLIPLACDFQLAVSQDRHREKPRHTSPLCLNNPSSTTTICESSSLCKLSFDWTCWYHAKKGIITPHVLKSLHSASFASPPSLVSYISHSPSFLDILAPNTSL